MIWTILLIVFSTFFGDLAHLVGMSRSTVALSSSESAIGVRTFHYKDAARGRPVVVEFWYPTDEYNVPYDATDDSVWVHPKEVRNVTISTKAASYPLILMSHGHRGDSRERSWLADSLVRQGFMVASIEHHGSTWFQYNALESLCFWNRAKDVSFALDQILEESSLREKIDANRIGFVGYSMGGMTGLSLAGAEVHNALEMLKQAKVNPVPPEHLAKVDVSLAEKSYRDPRIRSMLLICPAAFAYAPETIQKIQIPVGIIASIDDEILPHKEHAQKLLDNLKPYKLKILKNKTSHYAFLNQMTKKGREILNKAAPNIPSLSWTRVHKEATDFAIQFFQETL